MNSKEVLVQGSMFQELVSDCILTNDAPVKSIDIKSLKLLESLAELGITQEINNIVHYGIVRANTNGILTQTSDINNYDFELRDQFLYGNNFDRWKFKTDTDFPALEDNLGYIESLNIYELNGNLEPCIRVVKFISDMGYDDKLILIKDITEILALPPNVTDALIIIEQNQDPMRGVQQLSDNDVDYWDGLFYQSFLDDGCFRTVWTPAEGNIAPWNS